MKISIKDTEFKIKDIKNIYPSAIVSFWGEEKTPISLDWLEQNRDKVIVHSYAILILFKNSSQKIEIHFNEYEEMMDSLKLLFEKIKSLN
ncbi:hypothetical protein [Nitrosophilus labii]|uniref:hypothetical protein n=1 Tax=Nitrosophilus labii TaxID=2706014 RepID=UPI0016571A5D|nr:hypothetical protein [Nitrosophilus labii]